MEKNRFLKLVKDQFILRGLLWSGSPGHIAYVRLLVAFPLAGEAPTLYEVEIVIHLNKSANAEIDHGEYILGRKTKVVCSLDSRIRGWLNPSTERWPILYNGEPVIVGRLIDSGRPYQERMAVANKNWPINTGDSFEPMGIASSRWMQIYARILGELAHYDPSAADRGPDENALRCSDWKALKGRFHSFIESLNDESEKFGLSAK